MVREVLDELNLARLVGSILRNTAAIIVAFGVLFTAGWWVLEPRINQWMDAHLHPVFERLETLSEGLQYLQRRVINDVTPMIEFAGVGIVLSKQPVQPGGVVEILYQTRRNLPCATNVEIQFWSVDRNAVATQYTRTIKATQTAPTTRFRLFSYALQIPADMRDGRYSYTPLLVPDKSDCPEQTMIPVPPSEVFEVKEGELP